MDTITTAILAGIAGLAKDAIKDSYNALKSALKKKFGESSDLVDAVEKLEKSPEREDRQATVKAEVEIAKVNDDQDLIKLAQDLLEKSQPKSDSTEKSLSGIATTSGDKSPAVGIIKDANSVNLGEYNEKK